MSSSQTKICLFGGSFDPIHLGHTYIASKAVTQLNLDKVIFIPCQQSPHKTNSTHFSATQRLQMCKLATEAFPWSEVSDFEVNSSEPSFSWKTAEYFAKKYPNAKLYWLMGTDQWKALPRWAFPEKFASFLSIIVYCRKNAPIHLEDFSNITLSNIQHPASSTQIRKQISNNAALNWVHPKVKQYIKENS